MDNVNYDQYNKISDELCRINWNTTLNFIVILSKETKDKKRWGMHHEYEYADKKFTNTNNLITIKRTFDYYLSIENQIIANNNRNKYFIQIRIENILLVRALLSQVASILQSNDVCRIINGKLELIRRAEPIIIPGLPQGKWLKFEPRIITVGDQDAFGVRMYLSADDIFIDITIDKFMGFYYLINTIDMYSAAQALLNYIQRPALGHNKKSFMEEPDIDSIVDEGIEAVEGPNRLIPKKNKSAFDRMDDL